MADHGDRKPAYGPRGYLPSQAAKRARKIVLREEMGLGWPIAAVVAALVVAAAGAWFLLTATGPPRAPFEAAGPLSDVPSGGVATITLADSGAEVLAVRAGGVVRAFTPPAGPVEWCPQSQRLESPDGTVWDLLGARVGGDGPSLERLRSTVHDGVIYVDPTTTAVPAPTGTEEQPRCATPERR